MKATIKGITNLATACGIPESVIDRHINELITFALEVAKRERKLSKRVIRAWYFNKDLTKPPLFDILNDIDEDIL